MVVVVVIVVVVIVVVVVVVVVVVFQEPLQLSNSELDIPLSVIINEFIFQSHSTVFCT